MTESVIGIAAVLQDVDLPKRPTLQITFSKIFRIVIFKKIFSLQLLTLR